MILRLMMISVGEPSRWLAANSSLQACLNQSGRRSAIDDDVGDVDVINDNDGDDGDDDDDASLRTKCNVCTPLASNFTRRGGSKI